MTVLPNRRVERAGGAGDDDGLGLSSPAGRSADPLHFSQEPTGKPDRVGGPVERDREDAVSDVERQRKRSAIYRRAPVIGPQYP